MSLLFNAVKASEGLLKPLRVQRYYKKMTYANKNKKNVHAAGATPAFIRIGRALGVCVYKDEGRYGITRPRAERGQRSGNPPIPRVHEKAKRAKLLCVNPSDGQCGGRG